MESSGKEGKKIYENKNKEKGNEGKENNEQQTKK